MIHYLWLKTFGSKIFKSKLELQINLEVVKYYFVIFQFEENEKKRMKSEAARLEAKHKKQWDKLLLDNETALRELEQLQVNFGSFICYLTLSFFFYV